MKVSDYIADWIAGVSPRVYSVCGAGAMHLNDSICHHPGIEVMAMHHEQAAAFAAEADARVSGKPGIVLVTAGPGGTNAITGIASAYVDSIPMIVIAGQVTSSTLKTHERQLGMNELDGTGMVQSITKYATTIKNARDVQRALQWAEYQVTCGRPGPVWIEVPLDIQNAEIDLSSSLAFVKPSEEPEEDEVNTCVEWLREAKRPLLIIGNGARGANLRSFGERFGIPVVFSWNGADIGGNDDLGLYIGRMGIFGDRASNYAVQHADLILAIGTRLSVAQIGHHHALFAPNARKIVVDIDAAELEKPTIKADLAICADAKAFVDAVVANNSCVLNLETLHQQSAMRGEWMRKLRKIKFADKPSYKNEAPGVDAYYFIEQMQKHLADDAVVVTDVGIAFICTMQALKLNGKQRLFHSSGVSAMGYGFPASIGAYRAGKRETICLTGDGGMMLNLQELQTIAHHKLPIKIFVFANNGYQTIRMMQDTHFKRHSISSPETGLSCPDFAEVAKAFGIPTWSMFDDAECEQWMHYVLTRQHPMLCIVHIASDQKIVPRVQSRLENGKFIPCALDQMWPPLNEPAAA